MRLGRELAQRFGAVLADWQFWLALSAGPLFWLALYASGAGFGDLRWPLREPWLFAKLALLIPIAEEIIFRGWIHGALLQQPVGARQRCGVSVANVLTSALFAALHLLQHAPLWAAAVFLPSLVFGYFRERHRSVVPAALLHSTYNAGYFWLFLRPAV